jgi:hypothetical protein
MVFRKLGLKRKQAEKPDYMAGGTLKNQFWVLGCKLLNAMMPTDPVGDIAM